VIEIYQGNQVTRRIFVGGGFAEVNPRGCIVLAEEAMPVEDLDPAAARERLRNAQEDLGQAKDDAERARYEREITIAEAQIEAAGG
jgi:F-type H+-transporting ATPase subunit epsilon